MLDLQSGQPTPGIRVRLEQRAGEQWRELAAGVTNAQGRIPVEFTMDGATAHYHVPLLLSPFGYSTYRGN